MSLRFLRGSTGMDYNILKNFKMTLLFLHKLSGIKKTGELSLFLILFWFQLIGCAKTTNEEDPASSEYWVKSQVAGLFTSLSKPPSSIVYNGSPYSLEKNKPMNPLTPSLGGVLMNTCTSSPDLPKGISVDKNTCVISGTPTEESSYITYTITGTNSSGTVSTKLEISVLVPGGNSGSPTSLYYANSPFVFAIGFPVNTGLGVGTLDGGIPTGCISSPSLPSGLSINPITCEITGTPTISQAVTRYLITASNLFGKTNSSITIQVTNITPITSVTYSTPFVGTKDVSVGTSLSATLAGGPATTCTSSPSLPGGLSINQSNCNITGTPYTVQANKTYLITAVNSLGTMTGSVDIQIDWPVIKPAEITYPTSPYIISNVTNTSITPTFAGGGGTPSSCTSNPPLPAGLSLNQSTCAITGTPTSVVGAALYTITALNVAGSVNDTISLKIVSAPVSLAYNSNATANVLNLIKDQALTNEGTASLGAGGGAPETCAVTPSLPTGLVIDPISCSITGTPTAVQTVQTYTVTATNAANVGSPLTKSITIKVDWAVLKPAEITYPSSPYSISNIISASITPTFATGGGTPTSCVSNPNLPAGLTLNQSTCAITGIPTSGVVAPTLYTITASNMAGSVNDTISLEVVIPPVSLSYNNASNTTPDVLILIKDVLLVSQGTPDPTGLVGVPKTCTVNPSLPTGLVIDPQTCVISGTPTAIQNTTSYTISAQNAGGIITKAISIRVKFLVEAPVSIVYPSSPYIIKDGVDVTTIANPITPTLVLGGLSNNDPLDSCTSTPVLPTGLTLNQATCRIEGIPTAGVVSAPALYLIKATNLAGSVTDTISLSIVKTPTLLSYNDAVNTIVNTLKLTKDVAMTTQGVPNLQGGTPANCTAMPSLPTGMYINPVTCVISGTPTAIQQTATTYTITAENVAGSVTATINITIDWPVQKPVKITYPLSPYVLAEGVNAATIPNPIIPTLVLGGASNSDPLATCTSTPNLPTGLNLNQSTCAIEGTPTAGTVVAPALYLITAANVAGSVTDTISLAIVTTPLTLTYNNVLLTTPNVLPLIKDQVLTTEGNGVLTGGTPTSCTSVPTLPTGLILDPVTCNITGTPTAIQTATNYTITAANIAGSITATISITVDWPMKKPESLVYNASPYIIANNVSMTSVTPTLVLGVNSATSATYPISSCTATPALPTGLTINQLTCVISGTPTSTLNPTLYTIKAENNAGSVTDTIVLSVVTPPTSLTYNDPSNTTANVFVLTKDIAVGSKGIATLAGGTPVTCTATPSLPTGMSLDPQTCKILGTPTVVQQSAVPYNIVAANMAGSATANITIFIDWPVVKPAEMTYPSSPYSISDVANASITPTFATGGGTPTSCTSNPALPGGLTLNQATCAITGTPTSAGAVAPTLHTITASNMAGSVNDTISLELVSAPTSLAYSSNTTADVLLLIKDQVLANEGNATLGGGVPKTCVVSPSLPTGLVINNATCSISGTPTAVQTVQTYTITATNAANAGSPLNKSITIKVDWSVLKPAEMTYPSSPYSISNVANASITPTFATGGGTPTSCTSNPALPAGLTLNQATCAITGTPTSAGAVAPTLHTITASNMAGSVNDTISLELVSAPTSLAYSSNTTADVLLLIKDQVLANEGNATLGGGVPKTCVVSPSLPTGLVINNATCSISGTPTAVQTVQTYTITATNAANAGSPLTKSITIKVDWSVLKPANLTYPNSPYVFGKSLAISTITPALTGGGGTPTACTSAPSLPAGLSINSVTCAITGTPSATSSKTSYTVSASNMAGSATDVIEISVVDTPTALTYNNGINTNPNVLLLIKGHPLTNEGSANLTGGISTCTTSPQLPAGLSLNSTNCNITGNPTLVQDSATYRITAENAGVSIFVDINIKVDWATPKPENLVFPTSPYVVADGSTVSILSNSLSGGAPSSCSVTPTLPTGLSVRYSSGKCEIYGTPSVASNIAPALYTIEALNTAGSVTDVISLSVVKVPTSLTYSGSPFSFTKGTSVSVSANLGGGTATSCSITPTLPAGLIFDTITCDISGTPLDYSANKTYTVTATNPKGNSTASINIQVNYTVQAPTGLTFSSNFLTLVKNQAMTNLTSSTLTGGAITTCTTSPSLPTGLSIQKVSNTCDISGTPTTNQSATPYTVIATNEAGYITTAVIISVSDAVVAPTSLSYGTAPVNKSLIKGIATSITATISGGTPITSCSASPYLPGGLNIDSTTCNITGTPFGIQANTMYTITAANSAGNVTATLFIEVNYSTTAPTSLLFMNPVYGLTISTSANLSPTIDGGTPTTCSITPTLPAGLSINPNTCVVSGTPTALSSNATYTITGANEAGTTITRFDLSVNAQIVAPSAFSYAGTPYSLTIGNSAGITPTLSGGQPTSCTVKIGANSTTLPGGLSINPSTCEISGTPYAAQSATTYTITASNSAGSTTASIVIGVSYSVSAPTSLIYSSSPMTLVKGTAMTNATPSISGGTPSTCTASPTLPTGISINSSCIISGSPGAGLSNQNFTAYTIKATNDAGNTSTSIYIALVESGSESAPSSLYYSSAKVILKNSASMTTLTPSKSGGNITSCSVSPALPTGLSISSTTCAISGTPTTNQNYTTYTVSASNFSGSTTTSISLAIANDNAIPSSLSFSSNPVVLVKNSAMTTLTPTIVGGVPETCSISPTIPTGLSLDSTSCAISGTPSVNQSSTFYTITASNIAGSTSTSIYIAVVDSGFDTKPQTLSFASNSVILMNNSAMTTLTPSITGGTPSSCTITPSIPTGLSINSSTCAISGTPTVEQNFTVYSIVATNFSGNTSTSIQLAVKTSNSPPTSLIYATTPLSLVINTAMSTVTPTISGGTPTSCTISPAIPAGLSLNATTCAITGTPTSLSSATNYTVTATNLAGSTTATLNIAVVNAVVVPSALTYSVIPTFTVNTAITTITPSISGTAPTLCNATPTLPGGLSLNSTTCAISGTPYSALEAKTFTIEASNSAGSTTASITITISSGIVAPTSITYSGTSFSLTNGTAMSTATPVIVGGTPTTCIAVPPLPTGLSISSTTCAISGTPTVNQVTTNYQIVGYNSSGYAYASISITIGVYAYSWGTFTDNFNGTVSFVKNASYTTARNVLWMKCSYGQTYSGGTCTGTAFTTVFCGSNDATCDDGTLVTSTTSGGSTHIYSACNSYNAGAGTFGKTTWRAPTKDELTSLLVCSNGPVTSSIPANPSGGCTAGSSQPVINQTLFPNTVNSDYWTSSVFSSSQSYSIGFANASTWTPNKTSALYLRCVSDP